MVSVDNWHLVLYGTLFKHSKCVKEKLENRLNIANNEIIKKKKNYLKQKFYEKKKLCGAGEIRIRDKKTFI